MRICARFGVLKLDDLYNQLTEEELTEWRAMCLLDGWGKDNTRAGIVAAAVHNTAVWSQVSGSQERERAWRKPSDFVQRITFKKKQTEKKESLAEKVNKRLHASFGGFGFGRQDKSRDDDER